MKNSIRLLLAGLVLAGTLSSASPSPTKIAVKHFGGPGSPEPMPTCDPSDSGCTMPGWPPR